MSIVSQGAAGGLVMMALFRSDSAATKELCVAALFNLLCDNQSRVGLMREEAVRHSFIGVDTLEKLCFAGCVVFHSPRHV
jgi:hypothetical protein